MKRKKLDRHVLEALRFAAKKPCDRRDCGKVCKCGPCHAKIALAGMGEEIRR